MRDIVMWALMVLIRGVVLWLVMPLWGPHPTFFAALAFNVAADALLTRLPIKLDDA